MDARHTIDERRVASDGRLFCRLEMRCASARVAPLLSFFHFPSHLYFLVSWSRCNLTLRASASIQAYLRRLRLSHPALTMSNTRLGPIHAILNYLTQARIIRGSEDGVIIWYQ